MGRRGTLRRDPAGLSFVGLSKLSRWVDCLWLMWRTLKRESLKIEWRQVRMHSWFATCNFRWCRKLKGKLTPRCRCQHPLMYKAHWRRMYAFFDMGLNSICLCIQFYDPQWSRNNTQCQRIIAHKWRSTMVQFAPKWTTAQKYFMKFYHWRKISSKVSFHGV